MSKPNLFPAATDSTAWSANGHPRTRGELEAAIGRAFIQLEKESTGRGPTETRAYLIDDLLIVRLRGVLTAVEMRLARVEHRGTYLVKQSRLELTNAKRPQLEVLISELLGAQLRTLHTDTCVHTGEHVVVISLDRRPQLVGE